ncbi:hypothetical protein BGX24_003102 [Mortierella sp. AD032]|nr:hypothetical protein BGX24_003102 [Mortierella sp. AD032]
MKVNLLLNAMVVMAATVVSASAASANTTAIIGLNNLDPVNDSHSFLLAVQIKYNSTMPLMPTTGTARKRYLEVRESDDGVWAIQHRDSLEGGGTTLTAKGHRFHFTDYNWAETTEKEKRLNFGVNFAFSALVALASAAASSAPTNSTLRPTTGKKSNGYKKVRKLNDGLWSVEHTDYESQLIVLTSKERKYPFKSPNREATGDKSLWYEYFHCIEW